MYPLISAYSSTAWVSYSSVGIVFLSNIHLCNSYIIEVSLGVETVTDWTGTKATNCGAAIFVIKIEGKNRICLNVWKRLFPVLIDQCSEKGQGIT